MIMAAQVAAAPAGANKNKNPSLPGNLSQDLNSGGPVAGTGGAAGPGFGDGTSNIGLNNVDHRLHHHNELNMANNTTSAAAAAATTGNNNNSASSGGCSSESVLKEAGSSSGLSSSSSSSTPTMETGLLPNHKLKSVGGDHPAGAPAHHPHAQHPHPAHLHAQLPHAHHHHHHHHHHHTLQPPQQQQLNQFQPQSPPQHHPMQNNNTGGGGGGSSSSNGGGGAAQPSSADMEQQQQHGGKDGGLGGQAEPQSQPRTLLNKGGDQEEATTTPDKMGEQHLGSRYDHSGLGPLGGQQPQPPPPPGAGSRGGGGGGPSAVGVSEFNSYYGNAGSIGGGASSASRAGPCFDQHGGQQSPGMGLMHPAAAPSSMDPLSNSHEGYANSQYNHYPSTYGRPGSGGSAGGGGGAGVVAAAAAAAAAAAGVGGGGGYGGSPSGFGLLSSPRQQQQSMMLGPGGGASLSKASGAAGFQRFSGQTQHPSGATPTLNQLLTSPSPMMRNYGTGYSDYSNPGAAPAQQQAQGVAAAAVPGSQQAAMGMGKDMGAQYGAANPAWVAAAAQQRNHPALSPGNTGQTIIRSQLLGCLSDRAG
uniref:Uncharacterized protein n=1 Tax=Sphaerodactylus townsendi TaxID=933632 RepID=A0ACB8GBX2_9SAUR